MSSITLQPAPTTRLRLTVRGRRVLATIAALPAAVALSAAMISGGAALADRDLGGTRTASFETVTVQAGDSLWAIAERVAPGADPRDVVAAIVRLNALDGGIVTAGQELAVPAEYTS